MKLRNLMLVLAMLAFIPVSYSQLFIPGELQNAYENETRSEDGKSGKNYFQNAADYDMVVDFDPATGELHGEATITYHNNSPDSLRQLVFRNYMNVFKKGVERDFDIGASDLHDGVEISGVTVDGEELTSEKEQVLQYGTILSLRPPKPVLPGSRAEISLRWSVQMPMNISIRMGQYGDGNWHVAYWYPQISVYDDVSGWDTTPFTGSAEFYNDFNNYDVQINVPEGNRVWATGLLQDEEKHFTGQVLERLKESRESDSVISIISKEEMLGEKVLTGNQPWHYVAESAPDFAFSVSKSYIWDATSVEVEPGRRVFVDAAYKHNSKDFHKVAKLSAQIIKLFSDEVIGEPYPYPKLTAFNGGGGMEFPMMINDGDAHSHRGTVYLTAHEIGHTYFPFHVMTNEKYYAFMDEGLVSFLPRLAEGIILDDPNPMTEVMQGYAQTAPTMRQVPLMIPSDMISDYGAYRTHAYTRPANAFYMLQQELGEELFKEAMLEYIQRWRKKHPTPYDFFNTMEDVSGKEFDWFWKPWFFELGYPDLAIAEVRDDKSGRLVMLLNKGTMPVPVRLYVKYEDGSSETIRKKAEVWKEQSALVIRLDTKKKISFISLGGMYVPDSYPGDNFYGE
ncbi:MAG TPA: M1 family metallopeptidase [Bacteroidales bacterium]|nr:M1 family metallopeptidase [Bacteroidales bacterium]